MRQAERAWPLAAASIAAASIAALIPGSAAEACTISTTGVTFGTYDPRAAGADDGTGRVSLNCAKATLSANIALGAGGSGSFAPRKMASGAAQLNYNLYTSSSRTIVWGNGSGGTSTVTVTNGTLSGNRRLFSADVFGRIPALQNVPAGTYGDTVIVTVTF